jgi:lysozyme
MVTKNRIIRVAVFAGIIALAVLAQKIFFQSAPVIYPNFRIPIPAGYSTHGIDVSRYQRKIDWEMVAEMRDRGQKISFAIIKATEGVRLKDPHFDRNWREIEKVPLIRGAYLYFKPSKDGQEQADFFIRHVPLKKGDLPPVVDIEETNRTASPKIRERLKDCLDALQAHYGVKPMIYTNVDFYKQHLGEEFHVYPLWAAHYEQAEKPRIEREWTIWQHSCKGHVNGISAEVDFNVVNGSIFALQELCL